MLDHMRRAVLLASLGAIACSDRNATPVASTSPSTPTATSSSMTNDASTFYRNRLADELARRGEPWPGERWDARVLGAIREVPRHAFVPGLALSVAYEDAPQPIGVGQTISQPTVVAMMTQALELHREARVLEIGTGSGYAAAVASRLAGHVYTIELHEVLATSAREKLSALGYPNVTVRHGDGYAGWPEHAPFDRIVLTAAPPELPLALVEQLAEGGVLVAPVGPEGGLQRLMRYRKLRGTLVHEDLGGVMFVPMVPGD